MCTCITYDNGSFYFGRNLDLDGSFGETVTVTPRNFTLYFRRAGRMERHYAMIGMAAEQDRFPLYAEAVNEKGLCMAGLNFPGNAYYQEAGTDGLELASYEVIPWLLGKYASVAEAEESLEKMRIVDLAFSKQRKRCGSWIWHFLSRCSRRRFTGCWLIGRGALCWRRSEKGLRFMRIHLGC